MTSWWMSRSQLHAWYLVSTQWTSAAVTMTTVRILGQPLFGGRGTECRMDILVSSSMDSYISIRFPWEGSCWDEPHAKYSLLIQNKRDIFTYIYIYIYIHTHTHTHICTNIYTRIYTHIYIHTHTWYKQKGINKRSLRSSVIFKSTKGS